MCRCLPLRLTKYWLTGEECLITRGTWFYEGTWQPLEREQSNVLETKHLSMFQGHQLSEYTENEAKGNVLHTETFADFIVEWFSPSQIYLYSENKPSKIVRTVTTRLGFHKCEFCWYIYGTLIYS